MISYFASITVIKASPRWWKHVYPFTLISWKVQRILISINSLRKKTKCKSNSDYNVSWCRLKLEHFVPKFRRYRPLILKSDVQKKSLLWSQWWLHSCFVLLFTALYTGRHQRLVFATLQPGCLLIPHTSGTKDNTFTSRSSGLTSSCGERNCSAEKR